MNIVGFSGYARSGKDEAVGALTKVGWQRISFADKIRDFLYVLNPLLEVGDYECRVQDVIRRVGWGGYKNTVYAEEIRNLLQRLGVECGRQTISDNIWVDAALNNLEEAGSYAISDCRFVNEANGIRERGGRVFRIRRPGVGPANSHMSETALDHYDFDGYIDNDGTLEEFYNKVYAAVIANTPNSRLTLYS